MYWKVVLRFFYAGVLAAEKDVDCIYIDRTKGTKL